MIVRWFLTVGWMGLAGMAAAQDLPGDPLAGERLAQQLCAGCHAVAPTQMPPEPFIPTFEEAVAHGSVSELSLKAFLRSPHATMPDIRLNADETDDLVSYMLTLRR